MKQTNIYQQDSRNFFEQEEHYYKPVRVGNFYTNNYIDYKSNGDKSKTLIKEQFKMK